MRSLTIDSTRTESVPILLYLALHDAETSQGACRPGLPEVRALAERASGRGTPRDHDRTAGGGKEAADPG